MLSAILESITRPKELVALVQLKRSIKVQRTKETLNHLTHLDAKSFCYVALTKVSRSFAVVIQYLPPELRDAICVFYLVLRALDTIEDDMDVKDKAAKLALLREFYREVGNEEWSSSSYGYKDEKVLLQNYGKCASLFNRLTPAYREVIVEITRRMGEGMARYQDVTTVESSADYDEYCFYVAGLVGVGLTRIFVHSGMEPRLTALWQKDASRLEDTLSVSMGLFLQKVNIVRDYLEDLEDGRTFYPREIWSGYAKHLSWFKDNPTHERSLQLLDHMVCNALRHLPDALEYLTYFDNRRIFEFCAVPQIMALAGLESLYHNDQVFRGCVKIRKGSSAYLMLHTGTYPEFLASVKVYTARMQARLLANNPLADEARAVLDGTLSRCEEHQRASGTREQARGVFVRTAFAVFLLVSLAMTAFRQSPALRGALGADGGGGASASASGAAAAAAAAAVSGAVAAYAPALVLLCIILLLWVATMGKAKAGTA